MIVRKRFRIIVINISKLLNHRQIVLNQCLTEIRPKPVLCEKTSNTCINRKDHGERY